MVDVYFFRIFFVVFGRSFVDFEKVCLRVCGGMIEVGYLFVEDCLGFGYMKC